MFEKFEIIPESRNAPHKDYFEILTNYLADSFDNLLFKCPQSFNVPAGILYEH